MVGLVNSAHNLAYLKPFGLTRTNENDLWFEINDYVYYGKLHVSIFSFPGKSSFSIGKHNSQVE